MWITVNQADENDVCYDASLFRIIEIIHLYSLWILKTKCVKMGLLFRLWLDLASNNWFQYTRSKIKLVQHRSKINKSYHSIVKNRPRDIIFFDFLILFVLIVSHIYITWYCTQNTCHVSESKLKLETCLDWQFW